MANSLVSGSSDEAYGFNLAWIEEGSGMDEEICGVDKDCIVVPSSPTLPKMEQMSNNHYIEIQVTEEEVVTDDHWDVQNGFLDFRDAAEVDVSTSSGGGMVVDDVLEPLSTEHMERMGDGDLSDYSQIHPFSCDFCPRSFMRKSSLTAHMHTHQQRSHECNMCDAAYDNKEDLTEHMKVHAFPVNGTGFSNYNLEQSGYKAKTRSKKKKKKKQSAEPYAPDEALDNIYVAHEPKIKIEYEDENEAAGTDFHENLKALVRSKAPKFPVIDPSRPYVCQRCGVGFAREKALVSHKLIHDGDSAVECPRCREVFQSETDLAEHRRTEHAQRSVSGSVRGKSSYRDVDNDDRKGDATVIKQETYAEGFTCHMCNVVFETVDDILSHKEQHDSDLGVHACPFCPDVYDQLTELNEHINGVHSQSHACSVCHRLFKDQISLDRHLLSHSQEKAKCNVCGRKFYTKIALKRHMSSHEDKPSIVCVDCGAADFPDGSSLLRHRQTDHGINLTRLFPCFECGKTFNSRSSQQIHIRIHTGERPYSCRFCWKAFGDGGTLRKHERIHTGEKPYVCPVCSKAFNQRVVLREHVRAHHSGSEGRIGEGCYECLVCGQIFSCSTDLCAHLVGHSDENTAKHRLPSSNQPRTKRKPSSSSSAANNKKLAQLASQLPQTTITPASTISSYNASRTSPLQYRPGEVQLVYQSPKKKTSPIKLLSNGGNISSIVSEFMDFSGEDHNMNLDDFDDIIEDATDVLRAASCGASPSSSRTSNTYNSYSSSKKAARIVRSGHKGFHKGQNKRYLNKKESKTSTKVRPMASNGVSYASRYAVSQPEHDAVSLASGSSQAIIAESAEAFEWRSRPRTKNVSYHQLKIEPKYERATFPLNSEEGPPPKKSKSSKKKSKRKSGGKHNKLSVEVVVEEPVEVASIQETIVIEETEADDLIEEPGYINGIDQGSNPVESPGIVEEATGQVEDIEDDSDERVEAIETCIVQDDFDLEALNHQFVGSATNGVISDDDEDGSEDLSWSRPGEFACDMCHLVFPSYEELTKHIPMHI